MSRRSQWCDSPSEVTGREIIAASTKAGFQVARIKGSHHFLRHLDGRGTVVPVHAGETIGPGLLAAILRDCEIERDEFVALYSWLCFQASNITFEQTAGSHALATAAQRDRYAD